MLDYVTGLGTLMPFIQRYGFIFASSILMIRFFLSIKVIIIHPDITQQQRNIKDLWYRCFFCNPNVSMSYISFDLSNKLDIAITAKVKAGCELLERILKDPEFERWVTAFQWQTNDGQTFRRFYYSCGRNNKEVYRSLVQGAYWHEITDTSHKTKERFKVALCHTVEDYHRNSNQDKTICLDHRYLNNPAYTPIHIAAALCQEYCIYLGYPPRANDHNECWSKFTVPVAIARVVRDVAVILAKHNTQILEWCMLNDSFRFDYQPCSFTFGLQLVVKDIYNKNQKTNLLNKNQSKSQESHNGNFTILTSISN